VYAGSKSARNVLTNLNPNPTRKARPDLQLWLRVLIQVASDKVLAQISILFFSWVIKIQISSTNFHVYGNMVEENKIYQQIQKICRAKVCRINVSWANLGKISFSPPKTFLLLRVWDWRWRKIHEIDFLAKKLLLIERDQVSRHHHGCRLQFFSWTLNQKWSFGEYDETGMVATISRSPRHTGERSNYWWKRVAWQAALKKFLYWQKRIKSRNICGLFGFCHRLFEKQPAELKWHQISMKYTSKCEQNQTDNCWVPIYTPTSRVFGFRFQYLLLSAGQQRDNKKTSTNHELFLFWYNSEQSSTYWLGELGTDSKEKTLQLCDSRLPFKKIELEQINTWLSIQSDRVNCFIMHSSKRHLFVCALS